MEPDTVIKVATVVVAAPIVKKVRHAAPRWCGVILAAVVAAAPVLGADWMVEGRVVGVSDGDTITVLDDSRLQHKVRIAGIDTPEKVHVRPTVWAGRVTASRSTLQDLAAPFLNHSRPVLALKPAQDPGRFHPARGARTLRDAASGSTCRCPARAWRLAS